MTAASHLSMTEPVMFHQKGWKPLGLSMCECSSTSMGSGGVLHLSHFCKRGHWHDEKKAMYHIRGSASCWPLPLSGSKPSLSLNKMCAHPLFTYVLNTVSKAPFAFWMADHQHSSLTRVPPNRRSRECFIWYLGEKCKYHDEKCASKSPVLLSDLDKYNLERVQNTFKSMPFCQGTEVPHGLYLEVWIWSKDHKINNWKWTSDGMNELELDFDLHGAFPTQDAQDVLMLWF